MLPEGVLAKALVNVNDSHLSPTPFNSDFSGIWNLIYFNYNLNYDSLVFGYRIIASGC